MSKKKNEIKSVVFLGSSGFPNGLAAEQRITLLGRGLLEVGCDPRVICRKGVWSNELKTDYGKEGIHQGIPYMYTSDSPFMPKGRLNKKFKKIKGLINEFFYLRKLKKKGKLDAAILSTGNFDDILRYKLYSKFMGFPIALNFVEMASALERRSSRYKKIGDWLMENWFLNHLDGAMPISDKLHDFFAKVAPTKPNLKVPVICDYDSFTTIERKTTEPYMLYCASINFTEVADFVLKSYQAMKNREKVNLYMLISGKNKNKIEGMKKDIDRLFPKGNVKMFSNIPYDELMQLFTNAKALLIPLRPTIEDEARFPHKVGEYLATGNPVITTNIGEIKTYFEDGKTALVCDNYQINEFANKMDYVVASPESAKKIGSRGLELGQKTFHYRAYGLPIKQFLQKL